MTRNPRLRKFPLALLVGMIVGGAAAGLAPTPWATLGVLVWLVSLILTGAYLLGYVEGRWP